MYRGKLTPEDLAKIDTLNDTKDQIDVSSAYNLNKYGLSWPEIMAMLRQDSIRQDSIDAAKIYSPDSLIYILNREEPELDAESDEFGRINGWPRSEMMHTVRESPRYKWKSWQPWTGDEHDYFNYLEAIEGGDSNVHPDDIERAKYYKEWRKIKYGKPWNE